MRYFIDTEFIEGFHKPLFGKERHFIDLISIGIVCEDGREFYAVSNEYNYWDADEWVQENVISPMYIQEVHGDARNHLGASNFHKHILNGKSNKQIAEEIYEFVCPIALAVDYAGVGSITEGAEAYLQQKPPQFYGYFADYDWVLFCSLFGRMIDLPKGFPMYCKDLKQMLDERAKRAYDIDTSNNSIRHPDDQKLMYESISGYLNHLKQMPDYPKQTDEHNALADAKWNKMLYEFLKTV
jgi:hypothetical protein